MAEIQNAAKKTKVTCRVSGCLKKIVRQNHRLHLGTVHPEEDKNDLTTLEEKRGQTRLDGVGGFFYKVTDKAPIQLHTSRQGNVRFIAFPNQTVYFWHLLKDISGPQPQINLPIAASESCCKARSFEYNKPYIFEN